MHTLVYPNIIRVCEYNVRAVIIGIMDKAVNDSLLNIDAPTDYTSLVDISYTDDGRISSIQSNTALINRIKTATLDEINERLLSGEEITTELSAGTLSGISAFYGSGGSVEMVIEPTGYANAVFISEFTSAGINQTLHRIKMRATVSVAAFIPLYSVETEVEGDFLIAETVIVGNIPESYTHIISDDGDPINDLFNYT